MDTIPVDIPVDENNEPIPTTLQISKMEVVVRPISDRYDSQIKVLIAQKARLQTQILPIQNQINLLDSKIQEIERQKVEAMK